MTKGTPTAEERARAKAEARLATALTLVTTTTDEIAAMRASAVARLGAAGAEKHGYDPSYCDIVRDCGAQGMHQAEWAVAIGCSETAMWLWAKQHDEFAEAMAEARTLSKAWWEQLGRKALASGTFNTSLWALVMRAKWRVNADGEPEYGERAAERGRDDAPGDAPLPLQHATEDELRARLRTLEARRRHDTG